MVGLPSGVNDGLLGNDAVGSGCASFAVMLKTTEAPNGDGFARMDVLGLPAFVGIHSQ